MTHAVSATAIACANIALVKYWGKRDIVRNLPAAGSLSLTLDGLRTTTRVALHAGVPISDDRFQLDGRAATPAELAGVRHCLSLLRARAAANGSVRAQWGVEVVSHNDFPTASGLASSASGYAALVVAASAALELTLSPRELSQFARQGSGSAARSIFGGLVRLHAGTRDDGSDCYAEPLADQTMTSNLAMVIAEIGGGARKAHGSRDAMEHSRLTSPYYGAWLAAVARDLPAAEAAIAARDLPALGALCEANALAMHAAAIAARPAILYWRPATIGLLHEVRALRDRGVSAWATMDAGPHVKVLTTPAEAPAIIAALRGAPDVTALTVAHSGGDASLVS